MKKVVSGAIAALVFSMSGSVFAQEIDASKLSNGWLMNFYPVTDSGKPDTPSGRSIATLLYKGSFPVGYNDVFEIEPALKKYKDSFWLLELEGYLDLRESGDYTFALTYDWPSNRFSTTCGAKLDIEGKPVIDLELIEAKAPRNSYADVVLEAGLYRSKVKVFCVKLSHPDLKPELELSIRGPSDPILNPVPASMMKHLRP